MKKKLLALALTMSMVLGMGTTAFAAKNDNYTDYLDQEPVIPKTYVIENGTAPAETFTYTFEGVSYVNGDGETVADADIPAIDDVTISFGAISTTTSKDVEVDIDADDYALGVYTYKVTEVTPTTKTTGVTYSEEELYLVLTILRDESSDKHYVGAMHYESATGEDKETGFTNHYDAGSLTVTKEITGNMADMNKKFNFTITFNTPEGESANSAITVTKGTMSYTQIINKDSLTVRVALGHGESISFTNIPEGVTYTVSEDAENYTQKEKDLNGNDVNIGTVNGAISGTTYSDEGTATFEADTVKYVNDLTEGVDTGIIVNNLPYILILAAVVFSAVVIIRRKRYSAM